MKKKLLYGPYNVTRRMPLNYSDIRGVNNFVSANYSYGPTYLYELQNAYVSPYGVVMHDWRVLKESKVARHHAMPSFLKKIFLRKIKVVNEVCISAINSFYDNYYHFTAESLPRLFVMRELANDAVLLMHAQIPEFIKQYLDLLGFKNIVFVRSDEVVLAKKLLFPMPTADSLHQSVVAMTEVASWLKEKCQCASALLPAYQNIYISRKRAAYRQVLNEDEVVAMLRKFDFKVVCFEDYSIVEQIRLLSNVKNFISVHGAGISNIMYMPEGGLVIDLIHEKHYDQAFFNLANAMNHDILFMQSKPANIDPRGPAYDSFYVNVSQLEVYLNKYMK
ncbi:glycosyltransferase family 61 protein [Hymenobacter sp. BT491]|uniref:glycosyltransferase family 61 protein n=1 Tax=Hymenobacter sp. BT491 TaxID=2766779 RepID=UPI0016539914|nr:glycosyltransferase family 61 protein [Hymenobacter sp. BT491]MBC6988300.1 glycosyltransferase family 61 protein [Hymenobacter sp. BT491]